MHIRTYLCLLFALVLVSQPIVAQFTGSITGTVTDEQGGVIPGAEVTATHVATNTQYRGITGDNGRFQIPQVRLGIYRVAVELAGFNRSVVEGVLVETGGVADVNVALQIGDIQQEIVVETAIAQEVVNTTDAEISSMVDAQQVMDLPLNGRNASHLVLLQAGVFYERTPTGEGDKMFIHGQRHRSVNITLDGVDTQDNLLRASSVMLDGPLMELSAEHVQEFRVVTGISNAEYTRGGVHISAVTKGGGNDWHGALFWFHRNTIFNANTFFNNRDGVERNQLIRNQFGGDFSGPIFKDKTFFRFGYEQLREAKGIPVNRTVWTAEARQGIFRYLDGLRNTPENVATNPGLIRSVNLLACGGTEGAILGRDCVATGPGGLWNLGNIPTLDGLVSGELMPVMPLPNNTDLGDGLNFGGFRFNSSVKTFVHKPSFRLDHNFTDTQNLYFSFNYNDRSIKGDYVNEREQIFPGLDALGERNTLTRSYAAAWASTWSPTLISELRAGAIFGENAFPRNQPFNTPYTLQFDDISDPYDYGGGLTARLNRTYNLRETLTWIKGSHQIRAGFEFRNRYVNNRSEFGIIPEIDFNDTDNPPGFSSTNLRNIATAPGCIPTPGNRCASSSPDSTDYNNAEELFNNLTGSIGDVEQAYNATGPSSGFVSGALERRIWRDREFDWFIQDTWNYSPRLTLNFGLRWEYQSVPTELQGMALMPEGGFDAVFGVSGRQGFFNPGVLAGSACSILDSPVDSPTTDDVQNLILSCATKNDFGGAQYNRPFFNDDWNNFAPVLGLAWDPRGDGKTSVRAGFRISYMQDHFSILDGNVDDNEGLRVSELCNPAEEDSQIPCTNQIVLLRDVTSNFAPSPAVPPFEIPATRSFLNSTAQDLRTFEPDLATPYYNEWTLGIQREIFPDWALEVRYIGNRGVKMRRNADFNEYNVNALDPVTGMTFLESFIIAKSNWDCNRANGRTSNGFADNTGLPCITPNPLMAALIAGDAASLDSRGDLLDALDYNETGDFIWHLLIDETSRPRSGQSSIRGGSFWGQVLQGRFPANFFMANPFTASSRGFLMDGSSTYHGLQVEMRRRFSSGLAFQANYTYGKALSEYDGDANDYLNDTRPSSIRFKDYTRGEFMPRHTFNANWLYELPFGPGRKYMNASNVWNNILGGWNFGGLINWRSGQPFKITSNIGTFHRNAISDENGVNLLTPTNVGAIRDMMGRQDIGGGIFWIDPCTSSQVGGSCTSQATAGLFQLPNPGELGKLGAATFFGPSAFTLDFNMRKVTRLTETTSLEFRWEVFNAFNNVVFTQPVSNIFSSSFGQVLNTRREPRLMQFALRLYF